MNPLEGKSKAELVQALSDCRAAEHEYSVLLGESSDPIFAFYPDGTYRYVNHAFAKGVGKPVQQIIGNKIWDVFPQEEADKRFAVVKSVFESGEIREIEVRVPRPDGDRYYLTTVKPILGDQTKVVSVICISKDVTEHKVIQRALEESRDQALVLIDEKTAAENAVRQLNESLEQRVLLRTKDLADANQKLTDSETHLRQLLQEKEALLLEVHHRVKNNLQIITSLLRLEQARADSSPTRSVLADMAARIRSMALLHDTLYRSGEFSVVNLAHYLGDVARHEFARQTALLSAVELQLALDPVHVSLQQAIAFGLLTHEVIDNSLKHGFPENRRGEVVMTLHSLQDSPFCRLQVRDSGVGLPANFTAKSEAALGLNLVRDLTTQLGGTLSIEPGQHQGVTVTFDFMAATATLQPPSGSA